jgi:hypothetical protein
VAVSVVDLTVLIDAVAPFAPLVSASSFGESTGGRVDGVRREEPVQAGRGGRLTTGAKISAISSLPRVSFSRRARTRLSRTSRFSTRISQASLCAFSMSFLTSSSTSAATSSE